MRVKMGDSDVHFIASPDWLVMIKPRKRAWQLVNLVPRLRVTDHYVQDHRAVRVYRKIKPRCNASYTHIDLANGYSSDDML